ncbi:MAG TPA: hypothetical protein VKC17_07460 [Sphingomicrobium sp.]|nr:hypothetical protein [Sphingomicrobium sp.]
MSPPATGPNDKPCRYCLKPIKAGAVYCSNCEQFQTFWSRFRSGVTFPALIGALPLFILIWTFVQDHTVTYRSALSVLPVQCAADRIVVGLTNSGNRAALVGKGSLTREAETVTNWSLSNPAPNGALIVDPAKPLVEAFGVGDAASGQPPLATAGQACIYKVAIDVLDFGSKTPRQEGFSCACPAG